MFINEAWGHCCSCSTLTNSAISYTAWHNIGFLLMTKKKWQETSLNINKHERNGSQSAHSFVKCGQTSVLSLVRVRRPRDTTLLFFTNCYHLFTLKKTFGAASLLKTGRHMLWDVHSVIHILPFTAYSFPVALLNQLNVSLTGFLLKHPSGGIWLHSSSVLVYTDLHE